MTIFKKKILVSECFCIGEGAADSWWWSGPDRGSSTEQPGTAHFSQSWIPVPYETGQQLLPFDDI